MTVWPAASSFARRPYRRAYRKIYIRAIPEMIPKVFREVIRKPADNADQRVLKGKFWHKKKAIGRVIFFVCGIYTGINNSVLTSAGVVPKGLLSGTSMKTRWGDVTVSDAEAGGYALTFQNLPPAACRTLAGLSTTSWNSVAVGETELFSRAENTAVTPSDILSACSEAGNTLVFTGP